MFVIDVCWCRHDCCYFSPRDFFGPRWDCDNYNMTDDGEWECDCHHPSDYEWDDITWD